MRPPGHHASRGESCGYCLVNNVSIADIADIADSAMSKVSTIDDRLHISSLIDLMKIIQVADHDDDLVIQVADRDDDDPG